MKQIFENKADLNDFHFVEKLQENGFDIHNIGGTLNDDYSNGTVHAFSNGQYQLLGETEVILTCDPTTFYKTLLDVEKQFKYTLFG